MSYQRILIGAMSAIFVFALFNTNFAFAQSASDSATNSQQSGLSGTRKQIAIIIFSGLAGGILGLSTLSFYGRPQDHLSNIALGFAVGIISGTIYTSYKAATKPYETFDANSAAERPFQGSGANNEIFVSDTIARAQIKVNSSEVPLFSYGWTFK